MLSMRQKLGSLFVLIVLAATVLAVLGIWGAVGEEVAWKLFATLVAISVGLGVASGILDKFFQAEQTTKEIKS